MGNDIEVWYGKVVLLWGDGRPVVKDGKEVTVVIPLRVRPCVKTEYPEPRRYKFKEWWQEHVEREVSWTELVELASGCGQSRG